MGSWKDEPRLRPGNIDVHAHLLPAGCYGIPTAGGVTHLEERDGLLHLRGVSIAVSAEQLSSSAHILADMDAHDVAVRVVSPPPYAFPVHAPVEVAAGYARRVNEGLVALCSAHPDRLVPLGLVPVQDARATGEEMGRLVELGVPGVAVPPVVGDAALGDPELRHVLTSAASAGLAVLVHPMQQHRPGYTHHYLQNLVGNPVESATAIASCVLAGVLDEVPDLRIAFVHGAGCAPDLLGRWDHGWRVRADVSAGCGTLPSTVVRDHLYADSLTHSDAAAGLLRQTFDPRRILLGSDYPFDMADPDPVGSAAVRGFDLPALRGNALRWLGVREG